MDNEKESGGWSMYKLDDLFDFDGDGELDSVERMEMYQFMDNTANRNRNRFFEDDEGLNLFEDPEDEEDDDEDDEEDEEDDVEDDVDLFGEDEARAEFEDAGLDYDELEYMDPDERREMLEDTGPDPDDYDF